jgi:predicted phosphoribosyltransferase
MLFRDRSDAGRQLASKLMRYANRDDVVVLALPRGGVPVGYEVARALHAPLDVFVVRKLGVPGHEELAMGAIASGGVRIFNDSVLSRVAISEAEVEEVSAREEEELRRREQAYRDGRSPLDLEGRIVILVDDGLATGSTMRAAVESLRRHKPGWVVVAVPVGAPETCAEFKEVADDAVCATTPEPFYAVGLWYADFTQTSDEEVRDLLARGAVASGAA